MSEATSLKVFLYVFKNISTRMKNNSKCRCNIGFYRSTFFYSCLLPEIQFFTISLVHYLREAPNEIWASRSMENTFLTHFLAREAIRKVNR